MSSRRINSVSEIHADQLTFGSLQWLHGVFHPISYGAGRDKKHSCWRGVQTRLGELEEKLWYQLVESLIQKAGEQALLDAFVPFPVSWTVKMKKKQKETQDILSYHSQAAGCSDKARAKASGGRQPIEECGRTGL